MSIWDFFRHLKPGAAKPCCGHRGADGSGHHELPFEVRPVYGDEDLDGWFDGVYGVPARYAGGELKLELVTDIVLHSLWKGKHARGPEYFARPGDGRLVSAHFVVHHDGWTRKLTQCVPTTRIAFHSGNRAVNAASWGIEHDGPYGRRRQYDDMIDTTVDLIDSLLLFSPNVKRIRSHQSVPRRKGSKRYDPGKWFPWHRLEPLADRYNLELIP
jgi:hypothetical protein